MVNPAPDLLSEPLSDWYSNWQGLFARSLAEDDGGEAIALVQDLWTLMEHGEVEVADSVYRSFLAAAEALFTSQLS